MLTISSFANIKHILQKELFDLSGERLLSVCTVTKSYKKKKICYLCIASAAVSNSSSVLYQVKHLEREGEYRRKRSWTLDEVKLVDGKSENTDTHEFDIQLDKIYKWYAINLHERQHFLGILFKQIQKHVIHARADFRNVPLVWIAELSPEKGRDNDRVQGIEVSDDGDDEVEELGALSDKEIFELNKLVGECDFALKNAELFIEQLGKKLQELDGENIQSVLASENQVIVMMEDIERAIKEAHNFETTLNAYDDVLGHVRETMEKMGGKNALIEIANNNNINLMNELNKVIVQLDLPYEYHLALSEPDLKTDAGREAAVAAGKALQNAMNCNIDQTLLRLSAVQDQQKRFEKLRAKFSQSVSRYLNNLFIHLGNDLGDAHSQPNDLSLSSHTTIHKELAAYTSLMHWTKAMDKKAYDGLARVYTSSLCKIYDRDVKQFFALARQFMSSRFKASREDLDSSAKYKGPKQLSVPYGLLGVNKELWAPGIDASERLKFDNILEKVLAELEPVALSEQMFCIAFFQLDVASPTAVSKNVPSSLDIIEAQQRESELGGFSQKKNDRQVNEEVRKMMIALFGGLELELINFIQSLEKLDSFYTLYVLVRLTQHVMSAQDTHSFLSMTFASALVQVKRNFDNFMRQQLQSIKESKVPKRSKCGILPYVENFEEFATTAEEIFKKSDRRTDIYKWYIQLVNTIFDHIPIHADEHPKTPNQVVKMENYHHMYALLAQLKIPVLEQLKKEAKSRYNDALKSYVIKYFGRPLEKLNLFFEGVQQKVSQGVKETEISYQMAFSKQELRKVISQYPAKEVKKGLENLYKKVEKHLCEEENLLQVVWHAMQEEFIAQYNFLEERIQKCYAGAMVNLEFNIHDILTFFSDIARSH